VRFERKWRAIVRRIEADVYRFRAAQRACTMTPYMKIRRGLRAKFVAHER